ncbi:MAG: CPBP family intramembrane glutamic endopeptidase [Opitutales bacterium]
MPDGRKERDWVRLAAVIYLLMGVVGVGLIGWRRDTFDWPPLAAPDERWPLALGATLALILGVHLVSRLAHATSRKLRKGGHDIRRLLGDLGPIQIFTVAMASGIGEELLFRGWLMHETGLWISSVIFGIVHIPPTRQGLFWPFFAAAMGMALGWLYLWSASLVFPILLHAGINFLNLRMLIEKSGETDRETEESGSTE